MTDSSTKSQNLFLVGMILSMFCWGLSWASGKVLATYAEAPYIALFRFFITFISLLIILLFTKQELTIKKNGLLDLFFAATFMTIYSFLFFKGLSTGKAGAGGVLVTTLNPIITYTFMLVLTKTLPTRNQTIGLIAGLIAGGILLQLWNNWQNVFSTGNSYFLLASISWAILSIFTSRSGKYGSPITFSLWMYALCSIQMMFFTNFAVHIKTIENSDWLFWGNLIFSATIVTSLATTFFFIATSKLGAGKASGYIFLVPLSAALGSWIFLGEVPQWYTIVGGCTGILAVYMLNKK